MERFNLLCRKNLGGCSKKRYKVVDDLRHEIFPHQFPRDRVGPWLPMQCDGAFAIDEPHMSYTVTARAGASESRAVRIEEQQALCTTTTTTTTTRVLPTYATHVAAPTHPVLRPERVTRQSGRPYAWSCIMGEMFADVSSSYAAAM